MKTLRTAVILALGAVASVTACAPTPTPAQDAATSDINTPSDAASDIVAMPPTDAPVTPVTDGATATDGGLPAAPTWWNSIKAIVDQNCNNCHQPGGIAPTPMQTYEQARALSRVMAAQTRTRTMPPWQPRAGCRDTLDTRALTDAEIAQFAAWDAAGAPEGNMADYRAAAPRPNTTRPLPARAGDIIVQPTEPYLPNQRLTDDYHCFIVDPAMTETRDVVGVRVVPGNARIVHHMLVFEVRQAALPALQRLDDAEPGPGYTCFGGPGVDSNARAGTSGDIIDLDMQQIAGWAPGGVDGYMPQGTGIRLKPGSRIVMQVHYNMQMATRGMTDRTRVEFFLGERDTTQQAIWLPQSNASFRVPAGAGPTDPAATAVANFRNTLPLRVFGVFPHMHQRGSAIRVEAITASGTSNCMVDIPRWDFHWQQNYFFRTPYRPAAGAMGDNLRTTCVWDNRAANQPFVDGMQVAPRELRWGEGSDDEMCLNYFYVSL